MKKNYLAPEIKVKKVLVESLMLSGSGTIAPIPGGDSDEPYVPSKGDDLGLDIDADI